MKPTARPAVERWERWVRELASRPLDELEFEGMLECRDGIADEVEVAGSVRLFAALDAIDARFAEMTFESPTSPFARAGAGWWRARLPADPDALVYLLRR